ncbi:purine-nucleoside phosphorylase [Aureliella helgolandensis]|uniref:Purine nucleoside phosphorylase n=1 Tax=Aureliella helgolandensis TaxID=2527968 RepID=A0A518G830_9BACT|nr:purine-nucleoside phosphorylase [Aureliella helgolandensis]QDV24740.1 Purine nucleoside phosphorylase 1 [Aureliella helgolandensis]
MGNELDLLSLSPAKLTALVAEARDRVFAKRIFQPRVAIVLGSGLGDLATRLTHPTALPYSEIPGFPRTHAVGHAGQLILGFLAGVPVVLMQGRAHRYEGFSNLHVRFPIRCLHALGATTLIVTNAAGGLNTRFQKGDLMAIDSHIDFLWNRQQWGKPHVRPTPPLRGKCPYDFGLIHHANSIARRKDITLHQGTYLATLGPTYETRGEYRMFRQLGADAVGMSTVPEVLTARELSMQVLGFSVITNVASTDIPQSTSHSEVVDLGNEAGPRLMDILEDLLQDMAGQPD